MQVFLASRVFPNYRGGLGAYQRLLVKLFYEKGFSGTVAFEAEIDSSLPAVSQRLAWPAVKYRHSLLARLTSSQWSRMASHPSTHDLLDPLLRHSWTGDNRRGADVIHFVGTGWDFFGFAMSRRARQIGARFSILPAVHPKKWGDDVLDLRLYQQANAVICLSKSERAHLNGLGIPLEKLFYCPLPPMCQANGDGRRFRIRYELQDRPCVLFMGRRDEGKGYGALLRAWKLVLRNVPDAILILAGPTAGDFSELVSQFPSSALRDIGVPDEAEKADVLAACDLFCLPSAHESFGIVFVEAWSYGKPVICGSAPACRELVQDGMTGYWADHDPAGLTDRITELLLNPVLGRAIGLQGKMRQTKGFNEELFVATHLDAFGCR